MNKKMIIIIVSYLLIACIIPVLCLLNKKTTKKMGKCLLPFPRKGKMGMIAVDISAAVLLAILIFRDFGNMTVLLAACCVLSVYIMTKDGFTQKYYGVYEKGLIAPNHIVFFDDIVSFPVFNLPPEEQEHYSKSSLVLVTKKKGQFEIQFSSDEQCMAVVEKLKEMGIITIDTE